MGSILINAVIMSVIFWIAYDGYNGDPFKWVLLMVMVILLAVVNWAEGREYI